MPAIGMSGAITDHAYAGTRIIFNDTEKSNWTWDPRRRPITGTASFRISRISILTIRACLSAMIQIMRRWLDLGVDGFRLDAIPYLCEREGTNNENLPETHAIIKNIRAELDSYAPGKVLLAEANQWPEDVSAYFGDGDECHMAYHFPLMPRIYMAIAQEDRFPITDILRQTPDIPVNCQWALFLRNHDELTLEMVTDVERDYLWSTYATDPRARINLGIRRRLASLMDNDRRKIELMNSLLMSFPGTPIIYYGDEIGMGDNIYLGDRNGVRTPMQWTPDRNGGFSRCDPARLYLPMIMDPVYGYEAVNVEAQSRSLASLLSWTKRLISVRKSSKVFGRGSLSFIRPANRSRARLRAAIRKRSRALRRQSVALGASRRDRPRRPGADVCRSNCSGERTFRRSAMVPYLVTLGPYGFFWFLLREPDASTIEVPRTSAEFETLVVTDGWSSLLHGRSKSVLERDVLPAFLASRRWYAERGRLGRRPISSAPYRSLRPIPIWDLRCSRPKAGTKPRNYLLPLTIKWTRFDRERQNPNALAAVRRGPREGTLLDATADPSFIASSARKPARRGTRSKPTIVASSSRRRRVFAKRRPARNARRACRRYGAVEHDRPRRNRLCRQALSPPRAWPQSRNRGRSFSHGNGRVLAHPAPARNASSWRRTALAAPSPSCTASCKTRVTPGR